MKIKQDTRSVYIIQNLEIKRIKIGFSNNPKRRLKDIEAQSGCRMKLLYFTKPIYNYADVERSMHNLFTEKRVLGEWFSTDPKNAIIRLKALAGNSKVCSIIKSYERGNNATRISERMKVSRSGVVKYLNSKGYMLKEYQKEGYLNELTEKRVGVIETKDTIEVSAQMDLPKHRIEEMVKVFNEKKKTKCLPTPK